jgi:hypothetical protein
MLVLDGKSAEISSRKELIRSVMLSECFPDFLDVEFGYGFSSVLVEV